MLCTAVILSAVAMMGTTMTSSSVSATSLPSPVTTSLDRHPPLTPRRNDEDDRTSDHDDSARSPSSSSSEADQREAYKNWWLEIQKQRILMGLGRTSLGGGPLTPIDRHPVPDTAGQSPLVTKVTTTTTTTGAATVGSVVTASGGRRNRTRDRTAPLVDIVSFAETMTPSNDSDANELRFPLGDVGRTGINVVSATLYIVVRHHRTATDDQPSQNRKRPGQRITIYVYQVEAVPMQPARSEMSDATGNSIEPMSQAPIAQLAANVWRTRTQRLVLPTTVVQESLEAEDSASRVLRLRVVCPACGPNTTLVLGQLQKQKRAEKPTERRQLQKQRRGQKQNSGGKGKYKTPYLVIKTRIASPQRVIASVSRLATTPGFSRAKGRSFRQRIHRI